MNFEDCVKFANKNRVAYIATAEGDQPRVRAFLIWFADQTGFYFQTGTIKDIVNQLKTNPKIEVCFYDNKQPTGTMMRVTGKAEFVEDKELKQKVITDRPFLQQIGFTPESPELVLFRISKGEASFWTWETNLAPKQLIQFG